MPDATITSTASTFGTISGTFAADQSTVTGTVSGTVTGTLTGSVGVPGPAGAGVPAGGEEGQIIVKQSATDYDTAWMDNYAATLQATVRNETGATLTKGTVVYISGGAGNKPLVTKASASTEASSSKTFAILAENISNNNNGQAVTMGLLKGLNTASFTAGANLWLSTTAGQIVSPTPPASPAHAVFLGNVVRVHATQGEIEVRIQNGLELGELHDVLIDTPANGQVLKYDSAQGLWINGTDSSGVAWGAITGTLSSQTDLQTALDGKYSTSNPAGYITSSALTGYALESWVTAGFYPLTGNPSGFLTSASLTAYLTKADNLGSLTSFSTARDNLGIGTANTPVFAGLTVQGSGANVANLTPTSLTLTHATAGQFTIQPSQGIVFPDATIQTTAYPGPAGATAWGTITGTLSSQTDLQTALNAKYDASNPSGFIDSSALTGYATESWVYALGYLTDAPSDGNQYVRLNGSWSTLSVPADYITSVSSPLSVTAGDLSIDLSAYAPKASPALTGNVTITTNSTSPALFIEQAGTGNILTLHDQVSDTTFVAIDQAGKIGTIASTTTNAGFNVPHGTAPTTPVNGDVWTTTSGLFTRINGGTQQYAPLGSNNTFSNASSTYGSSTATGTIGLATGATISGSTKTVNIGTGGVSGSTTNVNIANNIGGPSGVSTINIGTSTPASTVNLNGTVNAATATAGTSTTQVATTAFVTTADNLKANLASPTFTGTPAAPTAAADMNTTQLATTAFVVGQAGSATPLVDGTATVGTSLRYARQDHVHPTDTSRAALASPTFTGVPAAPTAAVDTNTTQIATTAFVVAQAASATPLVDGTAAVGTSLRYARADHVHPTDTTLAPLASPTFTGTPTLPTGTIAVTQSTGNNTTAVATTAFVQQEVPAASTTAAGKIELATVDEALRPASSTLGMTPETTREMLMYPGYINLFGGGNVATSGTGAASTFTFATQRWHAMRSPNATIAGYGMYIFDYSFSGIGMAAMTRGVSSHARKWNNRIWVSGRTVLGQFAETTSGLNGDANCTARVMLGGRSSAGTGGMVSSDPGIGWRVAGGGSVALVMTVSNGTTLTETTSSFTPVLGQVFDWKMYSDGTGNVTLWVNDSQVATSTGGPTTSTAENYNFYCEVVEQTASATTPFSMGNFGSKVFWSQA